MPPESERYLEKLETALDLEHQAEAQERCRRVFAFQEVERLPEIRQGMAQAPDQDWPDWPYNDTFNDPEKMLLSQLRGPFFHNQLRDDAPLNIRSNYGTVILPSILGGSYQLTENSLPWAHHLANRREVEELVDRGVPDLRAGLGGRCFETAAYYRRRLAPYPKLRSAIAIYHPDLQGPFDVAHLLWGHDIFLGLFDSPDLVHRLLALITEAYRAYMRAWKAFIGEGNDWTTHWDYYIRGGIMLRDDSAVMLSTAHYEEFVKPYDQALLDEFGGGIHFCGRGTPFVASMSQSRNLSSINCSQPELNDVPAIIRLCQSRQIVLLGLPRAYVDASYRTGFILSA